MAIDPITRSVSVSRSVNRMYMTEENGVIEIYKNKRRVAKFAIRDFKGFLSDYI